MLSAITTDGFWRRMAALCCARLLLPLTTTIAAACRRIVRAQRRRGPASLAALSRLATLRALSRLTLGLRASANRRRRLLWHAQPAPPFRLEHLQQPTPPCHLEHRRLSVAPARLARQRRPPPMARRRAPHRGLCRGRCTLSSPPRALLLRRPSSNLEAMTRALSGKHGAAPNAAGRGVLA